MTHENVGVLRWAPAGVVLLCMVALHGCGRGSVFRGAPLPPPVVTSEVPAITRDPNLLLFGTRALATDVVAVFNTGVQTAVCVYDPDTANTALCANRADDPNWRGSLGLELGINTFSLIARRATGVSAPTDPYTVRYEKLQTPTVDDPLVDNLLVVFLNGQTQITAALGGTKSPEGSLELTLGGVTTQAVGIDGNSTWTAPAVVGAGKTAANVQSRDSQGNLSEALAFELVGTTQVGPTIDANSYTALTALQKQTLRGTKPANSELYFVINGGPPSLLSQDSAAVSAATWSHTFSLQEGRNVAAVYIIKSTQRSAAAKAIITLQSVPAPRFVPPLLDGQAFAPTSDAQLVLSGTLASGTTICISSTSWDGTALSTLPPCRSDVTVVAGANGSFTVTIPITSAAQTGSGNNNLYITARNGDGVPSPQTGVSIYVVSAPQVSNISLADNSVVDDPNLIIDFNATTYPGDGVAGPASQISSFEVCIDEACSGQLVPVPGGLHSYSADPNLIAGFENGSVHTVTITVKNGLGGTTQETRTFVYSNGDAIYLSADNGTAMHGARVPRTVLDAAGNLHVVWEDDCALVACNVTLGPGQNAPDIFYAKRSPTGVWSAVQLISLDPNDGVSTVPAIAVDAQGNAHIAWTETGPEAGKPVGEGVVHRTVSSSGVLGPISAVGGPTLGVADLNPSLAAGSSVMHLTYTRKTTAQAFRIMYARLVGGAWTAPVEVTPTQTGRADLSAVAALPADQAVVAWQDCRVPTPTGDGNNYCVGSPIVMANPNLLNSDILMRTVTGPTTVDPTLILVTSLPKAGGLDGDSHAPALVVDPNRNVWVFWDDTSTSQPQAQQNNPNTPNRRGPNVWYRKYLNNAVQTGSGYVLLSSDPNALTASQVSATIGPEGTVAAVWSGTAVGTGINVFAAAANFSLNLQPVVHLIPEVGPARAPSVAVDASGNMHVAWQDAGAPNASTPNPPAGTNGGLPYDLILYNFFPSAP